MSSGGNEWEQQQQQQQLQQQQQHHQQQQPPQQEYYYPPQQTNWNTHSYRQPAEVPTDGKYRHLLGEIATVTSDCSESKEHLSLLCKCIHIVNLRSSSHLMFGLVLKLTIVGYMIWNSHILKYSLQYVHKVDPGGPVVILVTGSEVHGFKPSRGRWIFRA